ncbi:uncharacterized protein BDZ99DRAFT_526994 [Mytilinidion resinicola]|uniref:Uncharacterized protein n=1 Tax=Mytilinidion resinicola TaxID=574789 RepID=A0A6A6Y4E3_9PEZI|nr:uncharacterized protein BDZ99DRAFT_526994 [Mytilinidion resinicola]KAF2802894.1 hypothetical protein BDZ99DRAFT_526994 [Mytilinidion resinicola]
MSSRFQTQRGLSTSRAYNDGILHLRVFKPEVDGYQGRQYDGPISGIQHNQKTVKIDGNNNRGRGARRKAAPKAHGVEGTRRSTRLADLPMRPATTPARGRTVYLE